MADPKIVGKAAHCGMSGHVSYSTQQLAFYGMVDRRANKINVARKHGTLKYKADRNPMRAEKTPRKADNGCFDFSIPTGRKDLKDWHRWEYPDTDFGLMGKFNTQKERYSNYIGTLDDYKASVKRAEIERTAMLEMEARERAEAEAAKLAASKYRQQTARSEEQYSERESTAETPFGLDDEKISNLQILGTVQPEVLAQWRAKRASKWLKDYPGNPLDNPLGTNKEYKVKHGVKFKPAGFSRVLDDDSRLYVPTDMGSSGGRKARGGLVPHHERNRSSPSDKLKGYADVLDALDQTNRQIRQLEGTVNKMKVYK